MKINFDFLENSDVLFYAKKLALGHLLLVRMGWVDIYVCICLLVCLCLWHINSCRLCNVKSILYKQFYFKQFSLE